jgi:hypothetical protein
MNEMNFDGWKVTCPDSDNRGIKQFDFVYMVINDGIYFGYVNSIVKKQYCDVNYGVYKTEYKYKIDGAYYLDKNVFKTLELARMNLLEEGVQNA